MKLSWLAVSVPLMLGGCLLPQPDTPPIGPSAVMAPRQNGGAPATNTAAPAGASAAPDLAATTAASPSPLPSASPSASPKP
ncbi:MAG: hypothetical protein JWM80_2500 [Cyanobacteria bacterium RYN_339]|nr:hypothetical protein [Cyanobacteria bacterium RYN_339]